MTVIDATHYRTSYGAKPKTFEEQSSLGKEDFLRLLITQLTHQDPTQPLQDREFIAQMAQFSMLEQMVNLNDMFTRFVEVQSLNGLSTMIGKKVTWTEHVKESDENGNEVIKETPKEGTVKAISFKDGKVQLVLADGSKIDVGVVETVEMQAAPAAEQESQRLSEGSGGQNESRTKETEGNGSGEQRQTNEGAGR